MWRTTIRTARAHLGRLLAAAIAIILGTGFVAGTFVGTGALQREIRAQIAASLQNADIIVTAPGGDLTPTTLDRVRHTPGVRAAEGDAQTGVSVTWPDGSSPYGILVQLPRDEQLRWETTPRGRLPTGTDDVAIDDRTAADTGLKVGSTLRLAMDDSGAGARTVRIVGIVDTGKSPQATGGRTIFAAPGATWAAADTYDTLSVAVADGTGTAALVDRLSAELGGSYLVQTSDAYADQQLADASHGTFGIAAVLLVFAAIALFVAGIVIANTFTVLLAQRSREMALLRCVGATRRQVFTSVGTEALLLGAVASLAGALAGTVLTIVGFDAFGPGYGNVSGTGVLLAVVLGVLVTVAAAGFPALRATRIPPLAALRPVAAPTLRTRTGRVRAVLGLSSLAVGLALLLLGALGNVATAGVVGGMISFVAVLVAAPTLIPAAGRLLGLLGRPFGVPGRLAAANAVRNPQRAASTATALLVGVTLIATMSVGASSAKATSASLLRETFPLDVSLDSGTAPLSQSVIDGGAHLSGVGASAVLRTADVTVAGRSLHVAAGEPAAMRAALQSTGSLSGLRPGVLLVSTLQKPPGVSDGQRVVVRAGDRSRQLVVRFSDNLPAQAVAVPTDLTALAPAAPADLLWLRARPGADAQDLRHRVVQLSRVQGGLQIGGGLSEQADLAHAVDEILLVVTALLGIAVVIAFVGVANTMALSVLERARESALLRALGLTRGQLRAMFAAEAVLLTSVGALLGIGLGLLYGWAGTLALLGSGETPVIAVPWARLVGFAVIAGLAGLAASVLPSVRASRVTPAAALATD